MLMKFYVEYLRADESKDVYFPTSNAEVLYLKLY